MRRYDVKKTIILLFIAIAALAFTACDGTMHNTLSSYVTFKFVNFPIADGTYDVRGGFFKDAWSGSDLRQVTFSGGAATFSDPVMMIQASVEFTVVTLGTWDRPWMTGILGNAGGLPPNSNFLVTIPMDGGTHEITVDGSDANGDGVADLSVN